MRHTYIHFKSLRGPVARNDGSAVKLNHSVCNCESQARSTRIAITRSRNPKERSEDIAQICLGNSGSFIANHNVYAQRFLLRPLHLNADTASR